MKKDTVVSLKKPVEGIGSVDGFVTRRRPAIIA